MSFQVSLQIDPESLSDDTTVGLIGVRLVNMCANGKFVYWRHGEYGRPSIAEFEFSNPAERDRFTSEALELPGVSVSQATHH